MFLKSLFFNNYPDEKSINNQVFAIACINCRRCRFNLDFGNRLNANGPANGGLVFVRNK